MSNKKNDEKGLTPLLGDIMNKDSSGISQMYQNWFLEYASYVILERAVPALEDGMKPVQRRILHAMWEMEDGRFNKVANIIGSTMQYHPHGDASISEAIVNMGAKNLLIETQGNWGDVRTGDSAAAARYIEGRISKFALEVIFNPQTTAWQMSYDGRKKEPVTFPVKFPILLAQGVEGIAVGLSTKILPHNFIELINASLSILKEEPFEIFPDFFTGAFMDVSDYNKGMRGGKVRIRAKIEEVDKKTLLIKDIPFGTTTGTLIESIIKANEKGTIKIKKVIDNTAENVEIEIQLVPGTSPDVTIDALYAFTDCEVSLSPNACVIIQEKPTFMGVDEILKISTYQTRDLLKKELIIKKNELLEKILFYSLEKIFIENKIYRNIEECETWEAVISTIDAGLTPFKKLFFREITNEDITKLTEIKIKRISKYDGFKADELIQQAQKELQDVEQNLTQIIPYTIRYYQHILTKYGKGRERKTKIAPFDTIEASVVAANNEKLYVNKQEGFVGYGIKKDEYICECSDIDDVIAFRKEGIFQVVKIQEKIFVGKDILYANIFQKNNERMVYNLVYMDGKTDFAFIKRFQVLGITRDKEYTITQGEKGSKILYFSANPNGEAETIEITLSQGCRAKNKIFLYDFATLDVKGRNAQGNILTKYPIRKIQMKIEGKSTLEEIKTWYDTQTGRLNHEGKGILLGTFQENDKIIVFYKDGYYEISHNQITQRFEPLEVLIIEKYNPQLAINALYKDIKLHTYFAKKFIIETSTTEKKFCFVPEERDIQLIDISFLPNPSVQIIYKNANTKETITEKFLFNQFIELKNWKSLGTKINYYNIQSITFELQ